MNEIDVFFFSEQHPVSRQGFEDQDLHDFCKETPSLCALVEDLSREGFRYGGDTLSDSKACTDVVHKKIYIGKGKSLEEAVLSLAYEVINAKNHAKLHAIQSNYFSDEIPTSARANEYAQKILFLESEAVYYRSIIALELHLTHLIKNQKYIEIIKACPSNFNTALQEIYAEMLKNGTVCNGKEKAIDHYVAQYFQYNQVTLA